MAVESLYERAGELLGTLQIGRLPGPAAGR